MKLIEKVKTAEALFFDLFHTLFAFDRKLVKGQHTSELLGIPENKWNDILFEVSEERLRGIDRDKYSIIRKLAHYYDPSIAEDVIRHAADTRERRFHEGLSTYRSSKFDVLRQLRESGKKIGLISNADSIEVSGWFISVLPSLFDSVVFSYEVGYVKPEPEIYRCALESLNVEAEDCLFIGDGGNDELRGAKEVGFTTVMTTEYTNILWPEKNDARRQYADYVIDDFRMLIEE